MKPSNFKVLRDFFRFAESHKNTNTLPPFHTQIHTLLEDISAPTSTREGRSIATLLLGIAYLNGYWPALKTAKLDQLLINAIKQQATYFNAYDITNTLWAFANIGLTWKDIENAKLDQPLLTAISRHVKNFDSGQVSKTLWSLAHLGVTSKHIIDNQLGQPFLTNLYTHLQQNAFTFEELDQIKHAQLWFDLKLHDEATKRIHDGLANRPKPLSSKLHLSIAKKLEKLTDQPLENEVCFGDVLFVDIYFKKAKLAIEVDGPFHVPHLDTLKDALLKKFGITVKRIHYQNNYGPAVLRQLLKENGVLLKGEKRPANSTTTAIATTSSVTISTAVTKPAVIVKSAEAVKPASPVTLSKATTPLNTFTNIAASSKADTAVKPRAAIPQINLPKPKVATTPASPVKNDRHFASACTKIGLFATAACVGAAALVTTTIARGYS